MLSGTAQSPIVSLFRTRGVPLQQLSDVIIHCDGKHFTLLRPAAQLVDGETEADAGHASVVPQLLQHVRARGGLVQDHELVVRPGHSISGLMQHMHNLAL